MHHFHCVVFYNSFNQYTVTEYLGHLAFVVGRESCSEHAYTTFNLVHLSLDNSDKWKLWYWDNHWYFKYVDKFLRCCLEFNLWRHNVHTHKNSVFTIKVFFFFLSLQTDETFTKTGLNLFLPLGAKFHIPNDFNYPLCGTIKQCVKPDHI